LKSVLPNHVVFNSLIYSVNEITIIDCHLGCESQLSLANTSTACHKRYL